MDEVWASLAGGWAERAQLVPDPSGGGRVEVLRPEGGWEAWIGRADPVDAATVDAAGVQTQVRIAPAHAPDRFRAGATICADVTHEPAVAEWCAALMERVRPYAGTAFAKLYVSPPGAGFAMHLDGHHVIVVQVSGRKQWWWSDAPAVPDALLGGKAGPSGIAVHTFPRDGAPIVDAEGRPLVVPSRDALRTAVLGPGDHLYLPPGTWHTTQAEATSVAVSFSPPRAPLSAFVLAQLRAHMDDDPRWRQDLVGSGGIPSRALRWAAREVGRVASSLDAGVLSLRFAREAFAGTPPAHARCPDLPDATRLGSVGGRLTWVRAPDPDTGQDAIFVFRPGVELGLPASAERFVTRVAKARTFTVGEALDFEPQWSADDTRELLRGLVEAGVLEPAEEK